MNRHNSKRHLRQCHSFLTPFLLTFSPSTVEKDANAAAQSDRIRVRNDGGRRTITVRGTDPRTGR